MGAGNGCRQGREHRRPTCMVSKVYALAAGQKVFRAVQQKVLFSSGMVQKDRAQDGPRRRRMA